ncbi:hypothetical protein, partial [Enterobacter cloacae]|uniref:hypothetical protein n=1 Tax=Enterobacter cloacae TaxID=550 RepID=UPI0019556E45
AESIARRRVQCLEVRRYPQQWSDERELSWGKYSLSLTGANQNWRIKVTDNHRIIRRFANAQQPFLTRGNTQRIFFKYPCGHG